MSKTLKKLGKVAAGLGAAYALSKMGKASGTDTGTLDTEQEMISRNIAAESKITSGAVKQQMKKAAAKAASARESEMFGLGAMDGAKDGKMIKAKGGRMVSKGQGIVMRPKKTIIS
jgi:hypothetical protein